MNAHKSKIISSIVGCMSGYVTTPSLTQTEAAARAALISVQEYQVVVDLSGLVDGSEVRCSSTIRFRSHDTDAQTFVDCAAQVVSARLNDESIAASAIAPGRIGLTDLKEQNELVVESVQPETATDFGVHKAVDPADGNVYAWTSFEPDDCRYVWACFDQPDLKATHGLTVLAPAEWTVLSNSGRPDVRRSGAMATWTFPATPPSYRPTRGGPRRPARPGPHSAGRIRPRVVRAGLVALCVGTGCAGVVRTD